MIDTLRYTRELEESGLSRDQAEMFVRSQIQMITDNVVTKNDFLNELEKLRTEFDGIRKELRSEIRVEIHKAMNKQTLIIVSTLTALSLLM